MSNNWYKKSWVVSIIVLFIGMSFGSSTGKIDREICKTTNFDGSLLGYVNDTSGNPIEGALVRVYFHEDYEEDYSDSTGYYHVTNIPICYCLKNVTCSKEDYKTEWVLLGIAENTVHDFILTPDEEMLEYETESEDNNEIEQMDNNKEIITQISGYVGLDYCTSEGFLLKKVELWTMGNPYCYLEITGYKKPLFPLDDSKFNENPTHIIAERFFGWIIWSDNWYYTVRGFAIGNIDWE
jgi:hypothetical protein